jgi:hypothetical protein
LVSAESREVMTEKWRSSRNARPRPAANSAFAGTSMPIACETWARSWFQIARTRRISATTIHRSA